MDTYWGGGVYVLIKDRPKDIICFYKPCFNFKATFYYAILGSARSNNLCCKARIRPMCKGRWVPGIGEGGGVRVFQAVLQIYGYFSNGTLVV